jgi:hypothetical protein
MAISTIPAGKQKDRRNSGFDLTRSRYDQQDFIIFKDLPLGYAKTPAKPERVDERTRSTS